LLFGKEHDQIITRNATSLKLLKWNGPEVSTVISHWHDTFHNLFKLMLILKKMFEEVPGLSGKNQAYQLS
jgi:hypothetical protein